MKGKIFVMSDDNKLHALIDEPYESEDILQALLEDYPDLLAGDLIDNENPRRWLLIEREAGVPDSHDAADRWSVDHLFLDQDGIPTLVKVKRSSDTRIRREVVGQMLDYASNAVVYWSIEKIKATFEAQFESKDLNSDEMLISFLNAEDDGAIEPFWSKVKTNLQAGRIRLIFVADIIPAELRRIVEFLNEQMDPAEVLAVEIKQYKGDGLRTLVPRVYGKSAIADKKKGLTPRKKRHWDEYSFFAEFNKWGQDSDRYVARKLFDWAIAKGARIAYGEGRIDGSLYAQFDRDGVPHYSFSLWTYGRLSVHFDQMKSHPPFDDISLREELRQKLNSIRGIDLKEQSLEYRPSIFYSQLDSDEKIAAFLETYDWYVGILDSHEPAR